MAWAVDEFLKGYEPSGGLDRWEEQYWTDMEYELLLLKPLLKREEKSKKKCS